MGFVKAFSMADIPSMIGSLLEGALLEGALLEGALLEGSYKSIKISIIHSPNPTV